jgi:hypothetical protein
MIMLLKRKKEVSAANDRRQIERNGLRVKLDAATAVFVSLYSFSVICSFL